MKSTFSNAKMPGQEPSPEENKGQRKEKVAVWTKINKNGEEYLSIKIHDVDGKPLHITAHKVKTKKEGMPDYVGFEVKKDDRTN